MPAPAGLPPQDAPGAAQAEPRQDPPRRILPAQRDWPLFDVEASRRIEAEALAAHTPGSLMRRAAWGLMRLALARWPHAGRVWIAAGPGGNGGDGLHAAAELALAGRQVCVTLIADASRLSPDAAQGLQRARQAGVEIRPDLPDMAFDLCIDALLGLGATRAPQGPLAAAIQQLNGSTAPCLAVDLPSGLDADGGMPLGADGVRAQATLSLLTLKPGLFTAAGRDAAGEIWFDDLGWTPRQPAAACATLQGAPSQRPWLQPRRQHDSHKGRYGDAFIVAGAPGMVGAARLAAHGAQAAGAGRIFVSLLDREHLTGDISRPEWLWLPRVWQADPRELAEATVVCGCGGADAVSEALAPLLAHAGALVLDADALNAIARDPALETLLADRFGQGKACVITPHPLEAARLLGIDVTQVQAGRLRAASTLARQLKVVVALKGSGTVIASPGQTPAINGTGNASLASGGSGDVLAGFIGGLWAAWRRQSVPLAGTALARACTQAACWLHGQVADQDPVAATRGVDLAQAMARHAAQDAPTR